MKEMETIERQTNQYDPSAKIYISPVWKIPADRDC